VDPIDLHQAVVSARGVVVPALLVGGVLTGWVGAGRVAPGARVAAYAGCWIGVLLTLCCGLLLDGATAQVAVPWWLGLVGVPAGVVLTAAFWALRQSRAVGLLCLCQVFGASAALLAFLAVPGLHDAVSWLALAEAVGTAAIFLLPRRVADWVAVREADRAIYYRWRAEQRDDRLPDERRRRRSRWEAAYTRRQMLRRRGR
jgi:hypothetical protein